MSTAQGGGGNTENVIVGGLFTGPVIMGRDITVNIPSVEPLALAQLPAIPGNFTGRDDELTVLAELLDPARAAETLQVAEVAGLPGVGKTALAIAAGHAAEKLEWYPGGVLFLDLHGYDQSSVGPAQALDALLRALGVLGEHIPSDAETRAALYRSMLARITDPMLVVLDNASSEEQVRLLLPGVTQHRVIVTSRHTLAGLDARLVDVSALDETASAKLLDASLRKARPSDDRISGDPDSAARLARVCGGLPLALQITAALLKADRARTAGELADDLASERERLERLRYQDGSGEGTLSVAAAFDLSYRQLDSETGRVFRLMALNPRPRHIVHGRCSP
jgi:hypothetical protein